MGCLTTFGMTVLSNFRTPPGKQYSLSGESQVVFPVDYPQTHFSFDRGDLGIVTPNKRRMAQRLLTNIPWSQRDHLRDRNS